MIDNKQINVWKGSNPPPTIYHIWLYNKQLKLYNDTSKSWEILTDQAETVDKIKDLLKKVEIIDSYTINKKAISSNPILRDSDITLNSSGTYIKNNISESLLNLDNLLTTQIID